VAGAAVEATAALGADCAAEGEDESSAAAAPIVQFKSVVFTTNPLLTQNLRR
jgi:hypothetical protein